jgi:hypothetical protein
MIGATLSVLVLVLVGPPKLPPIGGRSVPAPVEQAPVEAEPVEQAPPADVVPDAPAQSVPPPPPAAAPKTPPPAPPPPAAGPEVLANGPSSPGITTPKLPSGPASPTRPSAPMIKPTARVDAAPLRLVSADEVSRWDREAQSAAPTTIATPSPAKTTTDDTTVMRTAAPEEDDSRPRFRRPPHPPDRSAAVVLGYRFFRIKDALGRPQDWHVASIEVTPLRRYVRVNLITELGVEGGPAARSGDRADLLLMERLGLGMQYPGVVTPFVEFQGGIGGARIELFGRNDIALLYALGLDVGAQWAVGRWLYVHAAVGWIRPTFVWQGRTSSHDRVAFKLGLGF